MEKPISVEEALRRVLSTVQPLKAVSSQISASLLGKTIAEDIRSRDNFPPFAASIMDGYAVVAPLVPGPYPVIENIFAGANPQAGLRTGEISYITTGAPLPAGANAVVKIEDTNKAGEISGLVNINVSVATGEWVRQIGSDIAQDEVVVRKGQIIGPHELGLLATIGHTQVLVYESPVIGVLSTGNELVDPWETPIGSQIRDSNRISLIAACAEKGQQVVDLGVVTDSKEELRNVLLEASTRCDIVISSGGVSMGAADFVKPLLKEIGTVHFAKLNMKPGKPTTFATYDRKEGSASYRAGSQVLFFGLPGNPVSCLVTKSLFVDPAVKRMQGLDAAACCHPQLTVKLAGEKAIKLDHERPEYHRAILVNGKNGEMLAYSTGNQRSSRLLSMLSANALLFLPQGPGNVEIGTSLQALLIRPLTAAAPEVSVHPSAAGVDGAVTVTGAASTSDTSALTDTAAPLSEAEAMKFEQTLKDANKTDYVSFPRSSSPTGEESAKVVPPSAASATSPAVPNASVVVTAPAQSGSAKKKFVARVGLLTISDRASDGTYSDLSGPEMARILREFSAAEDYSLQFQITNTAIVPDEADSIGNVLKAWSEPGGAQEIDLLLTSGGTGFGPRDRTPEVVRPLLHREAPGVAQALLDEGLKHTPLAVLSRPVCGTRNATFIATLPGSVKAVKENLVALKILLPRIIELIKSGSCGGGKHL